MIATRLVNLIETHAEKLAEALVRQLEKLELRDFSKVPPGELRQRAFEIYRHLSDWLLTRSEEEVAKRYQATGARRAEQGVTLSSVILAMHATKENLWDYIGREGLVDQHVELCQELELLHRVELFFDRATYYVACGYERSRTMRAA